MEPLFFFRHTNWDGLKNFDNIKVQLILGKSNPQVNSIKNIYASSSKVSVFIQPTDYAERLSKVDFVVGAGGVSVLERFCLGVPAFVFNVANNQNEICRNLKFSGAADYVGTLHDTSSSISNLIASFKGISKPKMNKMMLAGRKLVDGLGVERILDIIL